MIKCRHCIFWRRFPDTDYVGQCRKNPPKFTLEDDFTNIFSEFNSNFPIVRHDAYCGKFRAENPKHWNEFINRGSENE